MCKSVYNIKGIKLIIIIEFAETNKIKKNKRALSYQSVKD